MTRSDLSSEKQPSVVALAHVKAFNTTLNAWAVRAERARKKKRPLPSFPHDQLVPHIVYIERYHVCAKCARRMRNTKDGWACTCSPHLRLLELTR